MAGARSDDLRDGDAAPPGPSPAPPSGAPPSPALPAFRVLSALALIALGHWLYGVAIDAPLNPRFSTWWADFARAESYGAAVDAYHFRRPPGYPTLLFLAHHAGFPIRYVNEVLLAISVVLVHRIARRTLRHVDALIPAALYAVLACHFTYYGQFVDEALFVPLALLALRAVLRDADAPSLARAVEVGVWCSAACLVRTFALAWIVPICGVLLVVRGPQAWGRRALRAAAFAAIVLVPTALLMLHVRSRTGFLTGMDRTTFETRLPIPGLADFPDQTTAAATTLRIVQSYVVDFCSPRRFAGLATLGPGFALRGREVISAALAAAGLAGLGACAVHAFRARRTVGADPVAAARDGARDEAIPAIAACLALYLVALVAIWSLGNNDPVHSRYVLPTYPFAILLATAIYDRAVAADVPERWRIPVRGLSVLVFAVQVWKASAAARGL